jgi:hypothetical protein
MRFYEKVISKPVPVALFILGFILLNPFHIPPDPVAQANQTSIIKHQTRNHPFVACNHPFFFVSSCVFLPLQNFKHNTNKTQAETQHCLKTNTTTFNTTQETNEQRTKFGILR